MNADALSHAKHLDEPTAEENKEHQADNEVGDEDYFCIQNPRRSGRNRKRKAKVQQIFACSA